MSNKLNELILAKCRDQVARSKRNHPIANSRFENFEEMQTQFEKNGFGNMLILAHEEAALMAMEELAGFMVWLSKECVPLTLSYCMEPKNQMYLETMYMEYEEYGRVKG